ncbi:MAG: hypothetical protein LBL00_08095 [Endomicrobium sp.]|jgi:hypothetical protein|nr:hypothetical protein [Endomicrobium sp.]
MKNILIIFLLVVLFFLLIFAAYIIGFKLYFNSGSLAKQTNHIVRMIFQRDSAVSKIKISPFGRLGIESFNMAQRGGFENGTLLSVKSASAKADMRKLFRKELLIKDIHVRGININLDYSSGKFNYYFFSNVRYLFMNKFAKYGMIKSVEARSILLDEAEIVLKLKYGTIKFKNIVLFSEVFNRENVFGATVSFDFETGGVSSSASFKFSYDSSEKTIYINDFINEEFSLSGEGKIELLENGKTGFEYTAKINKEKFQEILSLIYGDPYHAGINSRPHGTEEIIISYPRGENG